MTQKKTKEMHTVTGAFGYSGSLIAQALLKKSYLVNTLTNSVDREHSLQGKIEAQPFCFENPKKLSGLLRRTKVLYNNYWVRFNHQSFSHEAAVQNTFTLIDAAKTAGVERFVHISITNPSLESDLEYFSGKARIEQYLIESGLSYCILRPAVLFGGNDILINNIAWMIRHFPIFPMFGDGNYRLQPVHVQDLAKIAVQKGEDRKNEIFNVPGSQTLTYKELVKMLARAFHKKPFIFAAPPGLVYLMGNILRIFLKDIPVTRQEIKGLMDELLYVDPAEAALKGKTRLSEYIAQNSKRLGVRYASELSRRVDRQTSYE